MTEGKQKDTAHTSTPRVNQRPRVNQPPMTTTNEDRDHEWLKQGHKTQPNNTNQKHEKSKAV
jgi:hypothetical protein